MRPRSRITALVCAARTRARKRQLEFALTREWVTSVQGQRACALTGILFENNRPPGVRADPRGRSIDRINPQRGYTPDNVRLVCTWVNVARSQLSDDQFKLMIGHAAEAFYGVKLIN